MRWSYKIARVAGIDVYIHATFFLLLLAYGAMFYAQGGLGVALQGVSFILLLFFCVLLHEFGHALAARRYGIKTPDITLLPIGGLARLERMPSSPIQELVIAVAGPAVNVAIAAILFLFSGQGLSVEELQEFDQPAQSLISQLISVNLFLVAFNMIPAFPMDGGRVLRALLAIKLPHARATFYAARTGQVIAVLFAVAGIFGNFMLLFIAMFVFMGAEQELAYAKMKASMGGPIVAEVMTSNFEVMPNSLRIGEIQGFLLQHAQQVFPMVNAFQQCEGLVSRSELQAAISELPEASPASCLARAVPVLDWRLPLPRALQIMEQSREPILPVADSSGKLAGLVTRHAILSVAST